MHYTNCPVLPFLKTSKNDFLSPLFVGSWVTSPTRTPFAGFRAFPPRKRGAAAFFFPYRKGFGINSPGFFEKPRPFYPPRKFVDRKLRFYFAEISVSLFFRVQLVKLPFLGVLINVFVCFVVVLPIAYNVIVKRSLPYLLIKRRQYSILNQFNIFYG